MKSLQSMGVNPGVLVWTSLVPRLSSHPNIIFLGWGKSLGMRLGLNHSVYSLCCGEAKQTCTIWPPPQAERDTFRNKLKVLKDLVVKEGFVKSGVSLETSQPDWKKHALEDSLDSLQDGIADLKRKLTEVVECWNIKWGVLLSYKFCFVCIKFLRLRSEDFLFESETVSCLESVGRLEPVYCLLQPDTQSS